MIGLALAEAVSPKAISFPRRPSFSKYSWDCNASQGTSVNTRGVATPSLPSLEEQNDDENGSFESFDEELRRKNKCKLLAREVKHFVKNTIPNPKPAVKKGMKWLGMEVEDKSGLKRADGCLT
jgi:hypothetical protein